MTTSSPKPMQVPKRNRWTEPTRIGEMSPLGSIVTYSVLIFWSFFVLFPLYWVFITSFKLPLDVNDGPVYLPFIDFQPNLHAWRDVLVTGLGDTTKPYINSIIVALCSTFFCVLIGSMAAYALARIEYRPKFGVIILFVLCLIASCVAVAIYGLDWRLTAAVAVAILVLLSRALGRYFQRRVGNGDILFWMISQRILPPVVVIIPIYMMFQQVRLLDTHAALILCYIVVNMPIVVWLMHDFFKSIPIDLEESAALDGASRFFIFFDIILPLAKVGLAAVTLLVLILSWNEYILALFLSTSNAQTMPILVAGMNAGERGILWWTMCVVIILMILPVMLMALILQRFIARGVLLGAVKG